MRYTLAFLVIILGLNPVFAGAQTLPPSADPSRVEERLKQEPRRKAPEVILEEEKREGTEAPAGPSFQLNKVTIEGVTVYSNEQLSALYSSSIGKSISFRDLRSITNAITTQYRNDGYILSQAILPPQNIKEGIVKIRVIEGYVSNVTFEGVDGHRPALLNEYADKIKASRPLNIKTLERYLLLADDLPGMTARGFLRPGSQTGSSSLVVQLTHDLVDGGFGVNNRGSRFLGQYQGDAFVGFNSYTKRFERTALRGLITGEGEELRYVEINHEEQIGSEGTKLIFSTSYAATEPGSKLEEFDIDGESTSFSLAANHPILRSRQENLYGRAVFNYRDSNSGDPLAVTDYEDQVRALRFGLSYDRADSWGGVNQLSYDISKGLDIFGVQDNGIRSRANGDEDFLKHNAEFVRLQSLSEHFSALFGVSGQYSHDALLASEEFGIGGETYGLAYDPSEISGDQGVATKLELRYNDVTSWQYLPDYQLYTYYDIGKVWNKDSFPGEASSAALASWGIGSRFNITDTASGYLEFAVPLTRDVQANGQDGEDPRVFFRLTQRL